jgi:hypothetical protein
MDHRGQLGERPNWREELIIERVFPQATRGTSPFEKEDPDTKKQSAVTRSLPLTESLTPRMMDGFLREERHPSMQFASKPLQYQEATTGTPHGQPIDWKIEGEELEASQGPPRRADSSSTSRNDYGPLAQRFPLLGNTEVFAVGDILQRVQFLAREAEKIWDYWRTIQGKNARRARGQNMTQVREEMLVQYPGKYNEWRRKRILSEVLLVALNVHNAKEAAPKYHRDAMYAALMQWESEFSRQNLDPSHTPAPHVLLVISAASTDDLSEVVAGIDDYFICSEPACVWVGLNSEWAKSKRFYKRMCPMCEVKCSGWTSHGNRIPAQKIWASNKPDIR